MNSNAGDTTAKNTPTHPRPKPKQTEPRERALCAAPGSRPSRNLSAA